MSQINNKNPAKDLIDSLVDDLKKDESDATTILPEVALNSEQSNNTPSSYGYANFSVQPVAFDLQIQQASQFKLAQQRILDLETELENLKIEKDKLIISADVAKSTNEELNEKLKILEKSKQEIRDQSVVEISTIRENLQLKEFEVSKLKIKLEELELQLSADYKKIRVRERELENRLELMKVEKNALIKSKDETILNIKRNSDQLESELKSSQQKCAELNQKIEMNQEQFSRTVRALRLALSNLENTENSNTITLTPIKKVD